MEAAELWEKWNKEWFGIFAWRGDGRYHLRDVHGSRIFFRRATAEKYAATITTECRAITPNGYVVRPALYVATDGCKITGNRVSLI